MDKTSVELLLAHLIDDGKPVTVRITRGRSMVRVKGYLQDYINNRFQLYTPDTLYPVKASFWVDDITSIDSEDRLIHIGFMTEGWHALCGCWLCQLMMRQEQEYQEAAK